MWVFHDSFVTEKTAATTGKYIVKIGLARGVRIKKLGKKSRPFLLYILPLKGEKHATI